MPDRARAEPAAANSEALPQQARALARSDERVEGIEGSHAGVPSRETAKEFDGPGAKTESNKTELSAEDKKEVTRLKERDAEVRAHEQAHAAAGGSHAGSPSYDFETGPDGRRYAVGGEVSIDTSEVSGDAEASITKMQQVVRAANAPADPSGQDRKVAANARAKIARLQAEMSQEQARAAAPESPPASSATQSADTPSADASAPEGSGRQEQSGQAAPPSNSARAQRSYAQTNMAPADNSLDITACGKCGGGH